MAIDELSPRETEIVELSAEGLTNEAIAERLGLSIGTVNTYWLRIKLKTGAVGRMDAVIHIYKKRHELALREERVDWEGLAAILKKREVLDVVAEKARSAELRTRLAMLQLVMDYNQSSAWATDPNLCIHLITNGNLPSARSGVEWAEGKTVYEVFNTDDKAHPAVAAHLDALAGKTTEQRLTGEFEGMLLKIVPVLDEVGGVIGCISTLMITDNFAVTL